MARNPDGSASPDLEETDNGIEVGTAKQQKRKHVGGNDDHVPRRRKTACQSCRMRKTKVNRSDTSQPV